MRRATIRRRRPSLRARPAGAALVQAPQALRDALFAERLEEVVDDAELERLERVLVVRRRQDEHRRLRRRPPSTARATARSRRSSAPSSCTSTKTTSMPSAGADRPPAPAAPRPRRRRRRPPRQPRRLEQLDEVVSRGPLVLDDERAERRGQPWQSFPPHRTGNLDDRSVPSLDDSWRSDASRRLELEAAPHRLQAERAGAHVRVGHPRAVVLDDADERAVAVARGCARRPRRRRRRAAARRASPRSRRAAAGAGAAASPARMRGVDLPLEAERRRGGAPRGSARSGGATPSACRGAAARSSPAPRRAGGSPRHDEQPARLARLLRDEARDGVERVEQEVRLEVRAQARELGLAAELLRLEGADARALDRRTGTRTRAPTGRSRAARYRTPTARRAPTSSRRSAMCRRSSGTCMATAP